MLADSGAGDAVSGVFVMMETLPAVVGIACLLPGCQHWRVRLFSNRYELGPLAVRDGSGWLSTQAPKQSLPA